MVQRDPDLVKNGIEIFQELIVQARKASPPTIVSNSRFLIFDKLERLQERAVKVVTRVFGDSSEHLEELNGCLNPHWIFRTDDQDERVQAWLRERDYFVDTLSRILDELRLARTSQEVTQMTKTEVKLGDGTVIYGDFVTAHSIRDSFNKASSSEIPDDLKEMIKNLAKEVAKMSEALPDELAQQATRDLEVLTAEATGMAPRKQWIELSAEGLKQAATNIGEIGKPVLELVARILPLLKP